MKAALTLPLQAYGARPLKRAVIRLVDDPLSDALLRETLKEGDTAYVDCDAAGQVRGVQGCFAHTRGLAGVEHHAAACAAAPGSLCTAAADHCSK